MTAPRILPLDPPYPARISAMLESWMGPVSDRDPLRIFRTFAVHEELAGRCGVLGAGILAHGLLAGSEREVTIQRTCYLCGAEYEWGVHATLFGESEPFTKLVLTAGEASDERRGGRVWALRADQPVLRSDRPASVLPGEDGASSVSWSWPTAIRGSAGPEEHDDQ